jgi:hypothetical protein
MDRKTTGLILIITGAVSAAVGVVVYFTGSNPSWLTPALGIVTLVTNFIGLPLAFTPTVK